MKSDPITWMDPVRKTVFSALALKPGLNGSAEVLLGRFAGCEPGEGGSSSTSVPDVSELDGMPLSAIEAFALLVSGTP